MLRCPPSPRLQPVDRKKCNRSATQNWNCTFIGPLLEFIGINNHFLVPENLYIYNLLEKNSCRGFLEPIHPNQRGELSSAMLGRCSWNSMVQRRGRRDCFELEGSGLWRIFRGCVYGGFQKCGYPKMDGMPVYPIFKHINMTYFPNLY